MKIGADYAYPVYDPQTQSIVDLSQSVVAFEKSSRLGIEPSFRLETRMSGTPRKAGSIFKERRSSSAAWGGVLDHVQGKRKRAQRVFWLKQAWEKRI